MNLRVKNYRTVILLAVLIAVAALVAGTKLRKQESRRLTVPGDFDKLRPELTESEVQAILGPPHEVLTWKSPKHRKFSIPKSPRHIIWVYYGPIEEDGLFRQRNLLYLNIDGEEGVLKTCGEGSDGELKSVSLMDVIHEWLAKLF
jgi:hypothetical protein